MPFIVKTPPSAEADIAAEGKKIVELSIKLNRPVDVEGFVQAWLRGVRVVIETDNNGDYVGIAYVYMGERWLYMDTSVSVMYYNVQDKDGFLQFMKSIAAAMGAKKLIYEAELLENSKEREAWRVHEDNVNV